MIKYCVAMATLVVALFAQAETQLVVNKTKVQDVQWYSHDGGMPWPSYGGGLGFGYPSQTRPQAVTSDGVDYYTFAKCVDASPDYTIVYVADSLGHTTVLYRIYVEFCDPHQNSALIVDDDGYIIVYQSARGKWRESRVFKSKQPNTITAGFDLIDSGHFYAYPNPHRKGLIYTDYNGEKRESWVKNEQCQKRLVAGGNYHMTTEDADGTIHMLYDYHYAGQLRLRMNLHYMWSPDGCNWFNRYGEALSLPQPPNSSDTVIYRNYQKFTYPSDFKIINGEPMALVDISDNENSQDGTRELFVVKMDGSMTRIVTTRHNYDRSAFWRGNIVTAISNEYGYPGGYLHEFSMLGEYIGTIRGLGSANWPVVTDRGSLYYTDTTSSSVNNGDAGIYKITP